MPDPLSYHIYNSIKRQWLGEDEKTWVDFFHNSAGFNELDLANDIMEREGGDYVFACMPSA